jgi:thiosulfate/3-mercaptopyruvate sulfurtransferase
MIRRFWRQSLAAFLVAWLGLASIGAVAAEPRGPLVDAAWLRQNLDKVLILDASVTPQHRAGHIPGAVSADLYRYGAFEAPREAMEQRIQSWGISPGRKIVIYDRGGDMMAARLYYDLYYNGVPAADLFVLDGGLAKWRAEGGAVTQEATPAPARGSWRITGVREDMRVRLPEFLVASGDRTRHALIDALEPTQYFGAQQFFDRSGHVPNATLMPSAEFFNADKTFKSPEEIRRMARYYGLQPEQTLHSHCGGGVAAAVPWFALHVLAGYPKVKVYLESQREWLRDERGLPFWTYAAPQLQRSGAWLAGWNAPMLRMFDAARLNVVDVRNTERYAEGHVPFALNVPADTLRRHLLQPEQLAALLGPAGVNPAHEVVVMADNALTPAAALGFLAFEQLGHGRVSVLMDSLDEWGLRGSPITKQPTTVGAPKSPQDFAVPPATFTLGARSARAGPIIRDPQSSRGEYAQVLLAVGQARPSVAPASGTLVHIPHSAMVDAKGMPKPAWDLFKLITEAGVPRQAEVVVFADDVAEAALGYYILRLMGWPDVKVWLRG